MPDPSMVSYKARVGRYYKRVVELCEAGEPVAPDVVRALMAESMKLDEVFVYLQTRDEGESLKAWRSRSLDGVMVLDQDARRVGS